LLAECPDTAKRNGAARERSRRFSWGFSPRKGPGRDNIHFHQNLDAWLDTWVRGRSDRKDAERAPRVGTSTNVAKQSYSTPGGWIRSNRCGKKLTVAATSMNSPNAGEGQFFNVGTLTKTYRMVRVWSDEICLRRRISERSKPVRAER
jgi:hypothetical protein